MKTFFLKTLKISCLAVFVFFISCDKEKTPEETTGVNYSAVNTTRAAKTDVILENTFNIMENGYVENEEETRNVNSSFFPECTVITITPNGNGGNIILDFGTSCELNNGNIVSGKILLEYGPIISGTRTITYSFENYSFNGNGVQGGGEILREIANENGNPQSTVNSDITVSFPNTDITANRTGTRIAEWVSGVGSGTWEDNIYHITGNWNTTLTNGFERSGVVTQDLVRKLTCRYIVEGKIDVTQEGITGTLDFGDGECDNVVTFIINGQEYPILIN